MALVAAACSSGDDGGGEPPGPPDRAGGLTVQQETDDRLVVTTAGIEVDLGLDPLRITASDLAGPFFREERGLHLVRGERRIPVGAATVDEVRPDGVDLRVRFDDGTQGQVALQVVSARTLTFGLQLDDPAGVTGWGETLQLQPDEAIYGLTERIVDDFIDSEVVPIEAGTLDRRGETVTMTVTPTISAYAPFYQSSSRYGLLVDGTMPGTYDIGASRPRQLTFEFAMAPGGGAGFHVFHGSHPEILDQYTALTGRAPVPPDYVFRHWRGRDELHSGATGTYHGVEMNAEVADELQHYEDLGIPPPGVFHFDRPWGTGPEGYGELEFDPERFPNAEAMLEVLDEQGTHSDVWVSNWAIGARGREARRLGYLAPGSDRAIDFTDPDAAAWFRDDLTAFLESPEGSHIDGFFVDRSEEGDVPTEHADVWADGRRGDELHNAYPLLLQQNVRRVVEEQRPDDGFAIARAAYTGSQALVMTWGGDTHSRDGFQIPETPATGPSTDLGLRSVLVSIQRAAFMGLPFWGSDIGGYSEFADREVYARWIEVGAASPLMRFHGKGSDLPWDMPFRPRNDPEMTDVYRRYVVLHDSIAPYLADLAAEAHETGMTEVRPLVFRWPDEPEAQDRWDEWLLGDDLLVAPVWRSGDREREVWFPPGRWVDVWDRDVVIDGPTTRTVEAPLDVLPIYAAEGATVLDLLDT